MVLDANDNAPEFLRSRYSLRVMSSVLPGFPVVKVTARDADLGDNGRVSYKFLTVFFFEANI